MFKKLDCVAIYTEDIEQSEAFYTALGLTKAWEAFQDEEQRWKLVGMRFPDGDSELVLKNNPELKFADTEIVVENVQATFEQLQATPGIKWIREPFPNPLCGHVAVMKAPDGNVFVLVGK